MKLNDVCYQKTIRRTYWSYSTSQFSKLPHLNIVQGEAPHFFPIAPFSMTIRFSDEYTRNKLIEIW